MFQKTKAGQRKYRKHKRELEITYTIEAIKDLLNNDSNFKELEEIINKLRVLSHKNNMMRKYTIAKTNENCAYNT